MKVTQLCPTLCDPMDYTGHGILQARILEWVAFPFSRGSAQPRIEPRSPALQTNSLPTERPGKPFDYSGFVLESKIREHDSSSFVFHFQDCLGYLGSFVFQYKL